ncbi:hypothetical protein DPMN_055842 [Dreissena polymorpha]|uniref:Uncharacterized protein n=1 Tax=Dreissena polymorpha TaxID=45954 RepID=A0A9D4HSM6_DREPO|nr:hypothetical protein DPMN_055842 [Dreissena polymorpha]
MAAERLRDLNLAVQPFQNNLSTWNKRLLSYARTKVAGRSRLDTALFVNFVDREQLALPPNGNDISSILIIKYNENGMLTTEFYEVNEHALLLNHFNGPPITLKTLLACTVGVAGIVGVVWMGFKLGQQTRIIHELLPLGNDIRQTAKEVARKCIHQW